MTDPHIFLSHILYANTEQAYQRSLATLGSVMGYSPQDAQIELDRWLKRRVCRRTDYEYEEGKRKSRSGLPFTWLEKQIIDWAFKKKSAESKKEVTVEYIAVLLQRTPEEVAKQKEEQLTTKYGIKGFDL